MHRKHIIYIWLKHYICMHRKTLYMACLICMLKHIIYILYVCIVNTLYMACLICMHRKHIIYGLSYMYAS